MADTKLCIISYLYLKSKKRKILKERRTHRYWVKPFLQNRQSQGCYNNLIEELRLYDTESYKNFLRMSPPQFDVLLSIVGPQLKKKYVSREPISPSLKLTLTLRFLASGDSMISLTYLFRIGKSTVSKIIQHTLEVIWNELHGVVLKPPSKEEWIAIGNSFESRWNFPNCVGAIDGKHVVIEAPPNSGSTYYNYKGQQSIVLMAACDANYNFTLVDIGASGRRVTSDGGIFKNSTMGQELENRSLSIPGPAAINKSGPVLPYMFVSDEAFQLTTYMLRPFPRSNKNFTREKRVFNYRLSRARRTIENVFGILVAKWRIFRKPINTTIYTTENIIKATVCLHNYVKKQEDGLKASEKVYFTPQLVDTEDNEDGEWRNLNISNMFSIHNVGSNTHSKHAYEIRNRYMDYFINEGAVPWQWDKADNFNF